jgi:hypothetical protein
VTEPTVEQLRELLPEDLDDEPEPAPAPPETSEQNVAAGQSEDSEATVIEPYEPTQNEDTP